MMSVELNKFCLFTVELKRVVTSKGVYTLTKTLNSLNTAARSSDIISVSSGANLESRDIDTLPRVLQMLKKGIDDNVKQRWRQN